MDDFHFTKEQPEEGSHILRALMMDLPDGYYFDYLIYATGQTEQERQILWETEYYEIIKLMMFQNFDSWVERIYKKSTKHNG